MLSRLLATYPTYSNTQAAASRSAFHKTLLYNELALEQMPTNL